MSAFIISLKKTKKTKIYVDPCRAEGPEGVYLYPAEIRKEKLSDEMELSSQRLEELREVYAIPRAKKRAIALLARADRTEAGLRKKLEESLHDPISTERALDYVKKCGYVDDLRYAGDYISSRRGKKSFRMIRMELLDRGISSELIDRAIEESGGQAEEDLLRPMMKYMRKYEDPDAVQRQKILAHFCRKGYDPGLVRRVYDQVLEERDL